MTGRAHRRRDIAHSDGIINVVQITDCHLDGQPGGRLLGMDTDHSLAAVLSTLRDAGPAPDLLLATGDLADGGAAAAYSRLLEHCAGLCPEQFWLPGNHDDRSAMEALPAAERLLVDELRVGNWQILLLDSQVPGKIGGRVGAAQLERLRARLETAQREQLFSLVCLHHQPVAIGCDWLDEQRVSDASELFRVLDDFPCVRAVLWGHIHQEVDRYRGQLRLLASPSTCVQFAPGSAEFRADDRPPGYRWLRLFPDGRLDTGVRRVEGVQLEVNLDQRGYL